MWRTICLVVFAFYLGSHGAAQESGPNLFEPVNTPRKKSDASAFRKLIKDAYARSKAAKTIDDCNVVLDACRRAKTLDLTQRADVFVDRLAAWAYNRRGEFKTQMAQQPSERVSPEQAKQLEDSAMEDFETAVKLDPNAWNALHNRGVSHGLRHHYRKAWSDFDRVLSQKPDHLKARFNRAEISLQLGRFDVAVKDYTLVLQSNQIDTDALVGRSYARGELGDWESAISDLNNAIQIQPRDAELFVERANLLAEMHRWDSAAKDYQKATRLDPGLASAYLGAAWLMATCPDDRYRNPDLALRAAQRARELSHVADYRHLDALAAAKAAMGQNQEARIALASAIDAAPEDRRAPLKHRLASYEEEQLDRDVPNGLKSVTFE